MGETNVSQALKATKEIIDIRSLNISNFQKPGATKIEAVYNADDIGGGKATRYYITETKNNDPYKQKVNIDNLTKLENKNCYTEFLSMVQTVTSGSNNPQVSILVNSVNDLFAQLKTLESDDSAAMRQAVIDKFEEVGRVVSSASEKILDLRLEAERRLMKKTENLNNDLKALFSLNQQLLRSDSAIRLYDKRDEIIKNIATNFDIKTTYGNNGVVSIQSKNGQVLVNNLFYTKFEYHGSVTVDELLSENADNVIEYSTYDKDDFLITAPKIFARDGNDPIANFSGGAWGALRDLRDNVLVKVGQTIKSLGRNLAEKINAYHNNGSTYPPKGLFESTLKVSGRDMPAWGDAFTVHFVNQDGDQLRGGAGLINAASIDMKNLPTNSSTGIATVADLIKELNEKLDLAPSRERAAIGTINDGNGVQFPGQYLLNNIQLRAKEAINVTDNNSLLFDLDFQGNAHFDSNIEVLHVRTADDVIGTNSTIVPQEQLPTIFSLAKDVNTATNQNIKIQGAQAGRVITLRLRVAGENGVVSEGDVSFRVNENIQTNERISYDSSLAGALTNDFIHPEALTSSSSIARAKLVDENGIELDLTSDVKGTLVIETTDDSYRLVIQDGNFGAQFGFNNILNFDERLGNLTVNPDIVNDVSGMAIGRVAKDAGIVTAHNVGDAKAASTLAFAGVIAANDTITIGSTQFTFVNALADPVNPNEILIADGLNGPDGIVNRIGNHPALVNLIDTSIVGGNVNIMARNAGLTGNNINIQSNLALATIAVNGAAAAGIINVNLIGGTDKTVTSSVHSYPINSGNHQIIEGLSSLQSNHVEIMADGVLNHQRLTLSGLATLVSGLISDTINEAKKDSDIAAIVAQKTDEEIKKDTGIFKDEQIIKLMDAVNNATMLTRVLSMQQKLTERIENILFG